MYSHAPELVSEQQCWNARQKKTTKRLKYHCYTEAALYTERLHLFVHSPLLEICMKTEMSNVCSAEVQCSVNTPIKYRNILVTLSSADCVILGRID